MTPMSTAAAVRRLPRPLTGRRVLFYLIAFFGVVFAVNFGMARIAISSFSGLETDSAYKAGLAFERDVAAAHAQDARHWNVDAVLHREGNTPRLVVTAVDAEGKPLVGLMPEVRLAHPTDKRRDVPLDVTAIGPGQFQSLSPIPSGQWDFVIELKHDDETVFRSKSRLSL
jgi:nitrogen fixation protein FixH